MILTISLHSKMLMFLLRLFVVFVLMALLSVGVLTLELLHRFVTWFRESRNAVEIIQRFITWYREHGGVHVVENEVQEESDHEPQEETLALPIQDDSSPGNSNNEQDVRGEGLSEVDPCNAITTLRGLRNTRRLLEEYQATIEQQQNQLDQNEATMEQQNDQVEQKKAIIEQQQQQLDQNKATMVQQNDKVEHHEAIIEHQQHQLDQNETTMEQQNDQLEQKQTIIKQLELELERRENQNILLQQMINEQEEIIKENIKDKQREGIQEPDSYNHNFRLDGPLLPRDQVQLQAETDVPNELLQDTTVPFKELLLVNLDDQPSSSEKKVGSNVQVLDRDSTLHKPPD